MTGMQRWAVIIRGSQIFVGLIFVVEGTHENLNPTKISAYTVHVEKCMLSALLCTCEIHVY